MMSQLPREYPDDESLGQVPWGAIVGGLLSAGSAAYGAKAQKAAAEAQAKAQKEIAALQASVEKKKLELLARQSAPAAVGGPGFPIAAVIAIGGVALLAVLFLALRRK